MNASSKKKIGVVVLALLVLALVTVWWSTRNGNLESGVTDLPPTSDTQVGSKVSADLSSHGRVLPVVKPDATRPPADFDQLLARYGPEQQRILKQFYAAYGEEMMHFSTPEQLAWLKRRGFPMPEDVLGAQFLSNEQLAQRAKHGDMEAAFLYTDRLITWNKDHPDDEKGVETRRMLNTSLGSGSPFSGYLYAREEGVEVANKNIANAVKIGRGARSRMVGYTWAMMMGDSRLTWTADSSLHRDALLAYYRVGSPDNERHHAFDAMYEFQSLLLRALEDNPYVLTMRGDPWPREDGDG